MYQNIIIHYLKGIKDSMIPSQFFLALLYEPKILGSYLKIIKLNFLMIIVPWIIRIMSGFIINYDLSYIWNLLSFLLGIIGGVLNTVNYIELINLVSEKSVNKIPQNKSKCDESSLVENVIMGLSMTFYQIAIYATIYGINFFIPNYYLLSMVIKYLMLCVYHSFYCFNNLWQYMKIDMHKRIDIHERVWPYYVSYGNLLTILYLCSNNSLCSFMYGSLTPILISTPFLEKALLPLKYHKYPKINLFIFSYIMNIIVHVSKLILKMIFGVSV
jgi:hypothetical protein